MATGPPHLQTQRFFDFESGVETATFDIGERWEDTLSRIWTLRGWVGEDSVLLSSRRGLATLDADTGEMTPVYTTVGSPSVRPPSISLTDSASSSLT